MLGQGVKCKQQKSLATKDLHIFLVKGMPEIRNNLFQSGIQFDSLRVNGTCERWWLYYIKSRYFKAQMIGVGWKLKQHPAFPYTVQPIAHQCTVRCHYIQMPQHWDGCSMPGTFLKQMQHLTRERRDPSELGNGRTSSCRASLSLLFNNIIESG